MTSKQEATIRRILDAATASFAEYGFEGARMDEMAARAEVNKATIYYHIGDKQALYAAVLHEVISQQVKNISLHLKSATTPEEKLKIYLHAIFQLIDQRPHIPVIIMREIASGGAHLPEVLIHDFESIIGLLQEVLDQGHAAGAFTSVHPLVVHLMAMAPLAYYKKLVDIFENQEPCGPKCRYRSILSFGDFANQVERHLIRSISSTHRNETGPRP